jgi:LDH2 family malate/lactate/ureidoglycolate dehydrogenase
LPIFTADQLREICTRIFRATGASREEAEIVTNNLVTANLYGHDSHGVMRVRGYVRMTRKMLGKDDAMEHLGSPGTKPGASIRILNETSATALLDGNWGFGQVTVRRAMEIAMTKARAHGIGMVSARNCNHIGMVGEYTEMAARQNMIGIALCNADKEVAPYGSIDPVYGTDPISIAIPTNGRPVLLDMATSVVPSGKISDAITRNESIPLGWLIDNEGRPTTNPNDLGTGGPRFSSDRKPKAKGALLPFGGYKASGLTLCIELMGGMLSGAGCGVGLKGEGVLLIAIDIGRFTPVADFKTKAESLIKIVKNGRKAPGVEEILVAGEPEYRTMEERLRKGIEVPDTTWSAIKQTAEELNVSIEDIVQNTF